MNELTFQGTKNITCRIEKKTQRSVKVTYDNYKMNIMKNDEFLGLEDGSELSKPIVNVCTRNKLKMEAIAKEKRDKQREYRSTSKYKENHNGQVKELLKNPENKAKNLTNVKNRLKDPENKAKNLSNVKERLKFLNIKQREVSTI